MSAPHIEPALAEMMDAVFAEHAQDADLWRRLDDLGLVRLTGAEDAGGSGAGWLEAAELVSAAARHGARIPLAEHDLLACWLLDTAGITADSARRTVCLFDAQGRATGVPWASDADRIVAVWHRGDEHLVADLDPADLSITFSANMIGEPRDTVTCGEKLGDSTGAGVRVRRRVVGGVDGSRVRMVCSGAGTGSDVGAGEGAEVCRGVDTGAGVHRGIGACATVGAGAGGGTGAAGVSAVVVAGSDGRGRSRAGGGPLCGGAGSTTTCAAGAAGAAVSA